MLRLCGRLAAAALVAAVVAPSAFSTAPAAADPIDDARARLDQAQADAAAAHERYEAAVAERDATEAKIAETRAAIQQTTADIATLEQQIADLRAERRELKEQVQDRAAALYRNTNPTAWIDSFKGEQEAPRRDQLSESTIDQDEEHARQLGNLSDHLRDVQDELDRRRADLEQQQKDLTRRQAELDAVVARLDKEKDEFDRKVAIANEALRVAKALGALDALGTPVMGPSLLTAAEITAWYRTTGMHPNLSSGLTIDELAQLFVEEGTAENVRGDIAFAQSYLETGGFSFPSYGQVHPEDNNFAGIGACDSCNRGMRFPTPRDGVRAQIQLLRNYADGNSRAANLRNPVSPYLYGSDPQRAAERYDTFFAKGWAPLWEMMGHGKWATDPGYAPKVLGIYQRMTEYVTTR